jgi:hypothetical protein
MSRSQQGVIGRGLEPTMGRAPLKVKRPMKLVRVATDGQLKR